MGNHRPFTKAPMKDPKPAGTRRTRPFTGSHESEAAAPHRKPIVAKKPIAIGPATWGTNLRMRPAAKTDASQGATSRATPRSNLARFVVV